MRRLGGGAATSPTPQPGAADEPGGADAAGGANGRALQGSASVGFSPPAAAAGAAAGAAGERAAASSSSSDPSGAANSSSATNAGGSSSSSSSGFAGLKSLARSVLDALPESVPFSPAAQDAAAAAEAPDAKAFGAPLAAATFVAPAVLVAMLAFLDSTLLEAEGLFRISASASAVAQLRERLDAIYFAAAVRRARRVREATAQLAREQRAAAAAGGGESGSGSGSGSGAPSPSSSSLSAPSSASSSKTPSPASSALSTAAPPPTTASSSSAATSSSSSSSSTPSTSTAAAADATEPAATSGSGSSTGGFMRLVFGGSSDSKPADGDAERAAQGAAAGGGDAPAAAEASSSSSSSSSAAAAASATTTGTGTGTAALAVSAATTRWLAEQEVLEDDQLHDELDAVFDALAPVPGSVHTVANCLKQWFRDLPEPLLTYNLHDSFCQAMADAALEDRIAGESKSAEAVEQAPAAASAGEEEPDRRHRVLQGLLLELPRGRQVVLVLLVLLLRRVTARSESNLMPPRNVATIFAPNILRGLNLDLAQEMENTKYGADLLHILIVDYELIFAPVEAALLQAHKASLAAQGELTFSQVAAGDDDDHDPAVDGKAEAQQQQPQQQGKQGGEEGGLPGDASAESSSLAPAVGPAALTASLESLPDEDAATDGSARQDSRASQVSDPVTHARALAAGAAEGATAPAPDSPGAHPNRRALAGRSISRAALNSWFVVSKSQEDED